MTETRDEQQSMERRRDHELREGVDSFLSDVRGLHGQLQGMNDDEVEAAYRRFLKHTHMIWERLLEGEKPEE